MRKKYGWLSACLMLLCTLLTTACSQEAEEPEEGWIATFVSVPDKVFSNVMFYDAAEEGVYTVANTAGGAVSLYALDTEEEKKLFSLAEDEYALGMCVGGDAQERKLLLLVLRYGRNDAGEINYKVHSCVLQLFTAEGQLCWESALEEDRSDNLTQHLFMSGDGRIFWGTDKVLYVLSADGQQLCELEYPAADAVNSRYYDVFACGEAGEVYFIQPGKSGISGEIGQYTIYQWNEASLKLEELASVAEKEPVQTMGGQGLYFRDYDAVYRYDLQTEDLSFVFSLTENMITGYRASKLLQTENGWKVLCKDIHDGLGVQMATLEWGSLGQTERLSLAAINSQLYNGQVILFNQSHPEYFIQIRSFGAENTEDELEQLRLSLSAKDAPDLVEIWSTEEYLNYARKEWLLDLSSYIEKSENINIEDFVPGVREAMTVNGKLYSLPNGFWISTLAVPESVAGGRTSWTIEEFLDFMEEYPDAYYLPISDSKGLPDKSERKRLILGLALTRGVEGFIDTEKGKVDLDNERFRSLLTRINNLQVNENAGLYWDDLEKRVADGEVLLRYPTLMGVTTLLQLEREQGERMVLIGFPSAEEGNGGGMLYVQSPLAVSAKTRHGDAAWEFLEESVLLETDAEDSSSYFPARQDALEQLIENAQKSKRAAFDSDFDEESGLPKRHADLIQNAIDTAVIKDPVISQINSIISEEASYYFAGEKSLDEVIDIMENRAELYFNENR